MNSDNDLVLLSIDQGIARIRFNRPGALNAINASLARQWREAARHVGTRADVRVVVLAGEGRAFMAGGDLQAFHADPSRAGATARDIIDPLNDGLAALAEGDAPVIASVHGAVAGAGMSIALGADLVIASEDAKFNMAYALIGASLDAGGSWFLPRIVGLQRAMAIALLSEPLSAAKALEEGLVHRVAAADRLAAETDVLARRLAEGPTGAYGRIRRLLREGLQRNLADQLRAERDAFVQGAGMPEFGEGVDAFLNKRAPVYLGR
ncbi:2-(1,2-epoxy-1,2-dihydrophenyl)acetyl-CoA isomerase [Variovorax sp. HW608]|uniref:enoyl-CoA hydratase/isomerase family protein n=1 Tax=Variovorax sp. HW608 TaxID=1034889 RepID=UPI00081F7C7C|nr:enoyl-CoA hydratase-related protein [Variovorax sp. HW608]SCK15384.1 2-(1,2-epoxy-1,2-dihydrophenyl)acetyl-CoA isomerase [Variovorax sp. HW608]